MRYLALFLVVLLATIVGCGGGQKGEQAKTEKASSTREARTDDDLIRESAPQIKLYKDPVSGEYITAEAAAASYTYEGTTYKFETKENYETFKQDPEKYIETSEAQN